MFQKNLHIQIRYHHLVWSDLSDYHPKTTAVKEKLNRAKCEFLKDVLNDDFTFLFKNIKLGIHKNRIVTIKYENNRIYFVYYNIYNNNINIIES